MSCIYIATNVKSGGIYVGQTICKFERRLAGHKCDYKRVDSHFYRAIRKYGWDAFSWVVIDEADTKEELNELEKEYIAYYRMIGKYLYNATDGGEGSSGVKLSDETKVKMSAASKGKPKAEQHRLRIAEANRNKNKGKDSRALVWSITLVSPDGVEYSDIRNLKEFSRQHNIDYITTLGVAKGRYKQCRGWHLKGDRNNV